MKKKVITWSNGGGGVSPLAPPAYVTASHRLQITVLCTQYSDKTKKWGSLKVKINLTTYINIILKFKIEHAKYYFL